MAAVAVVVVSTLLNAGYFLPIVYAAFFRQESNPGHDNPGHGDHGEAPMMMVGALTLTAMGTVAFFIFPDLPLELARQILESG